MARLDGDFLLRPLDTAWFRGSKPFVAGESSADAGLFPPTAWTFQGMVRTRLLMAAIPGDLDGASSEAIGRIVGPPERLPGGWRIEGPFPARREEGDLVPWFPAPRFLFRADGEVPQRARRVPDAGIATDLPQGQVLLGAPRVARARPLEGWIDAGNLLWALTGEGEWRSDGHAPDVPPFVADEVRPGIRVEAASGTAADHMLYSAGHHRFAPGSGLLGRLTAPGLDGVPSDALRTGWVPAGKKGRLAALEDPGVVHAAWEDIRAGRHHSPPEGRCLAWVVLLTAAIVEEGAEVPFELPPGTRLIGRLCRAGEPVGGFDRAGGGGRPVRATWAAGSSFLVALPDDGPEERLVAVRRLQLLPPQAPTEWESLGFGQRAVGLCDPDTLEPPISKGARHV